MAKYCYSQLSLPTGVIRLLRLLPSERDVESMQGELFEYRLRNSDKPSHPYEALSYVWGDDEKPQSISIGNLNLDITQNLYTALLHLRDHDCSRILWVDAICINQEDNNEKGQQVQSMAKIYAKASRVIVWLGEAAVDSDQALEVIRKAAEEQSTNSAINETNQQTILTLLKRPWFQRIWVRGQRSPIWAEVIDKVDSGPSGSCRSSTCPDQVWLHGDRRIYVLLRPKRIESLL